MFSDRRCLWIIVFSVILSITGFIQIRFRVFMYTEKFVGTEKNNTMEFMSRENLQRKTPTNLPTKFISVVPATTLRPNSALLSSLSSSSSSLGTTTTSLTSYSSSMTRLPKDVSQYVSFSGGFADGRRLGNQIFCLAAVIYVAELTGREPAIENFNYVIELDKVFDLNIERFDSICPCYHIEENKHLAFDETTDAIVLNNPGIANKAIMIGGYRQSWRYTMAIERRLRRHLVFKGKIRNYSQNFLRNHIPPDWKRVGFLRVAIHVRRADILRKDMLDFGYTVPNETYFKKAMNYFTERFKKVHFLIFSDDHDWSREYITAELNQWPNTSIHITHVSNNSAGQDLAIMSMCDHVIMSTGTYGWWAAWLAKGVTIYYENWPRNGSALDKEFIKNDFFPQNWIPMTD